MSNEKITKLQEGVLDMDSNLLGKNKVKEKEFASEDVIKKKILFVTRPIAPPWDEASKNFAYHLAKNLATLNQNLEIHLMTKGKLVGLPKNIIQHPIYTQSENDFAFSQKIRSLFFQLQKKNHFDIVHYFFTPSKLNSFLIKNFLHPKNSKTIQTVATLREDINSDETIRKMIFADLPVAYSKYSALKLKKLGFTNAQHIYPGIDLQLYSPQDKHPDLLAETGIEKDNFVIAFSAEYVRLGGIDNVIDAFLKLKKEIFNLKLLLIVRVKNKKDAEKKGLVKKKLKDNNVLEKVIFADEINFEKWNMGNVYNLSDISLFTVHNMNGKFDVPLVVPEAMACQKPVILSDIPILREFANDNNAFIIPPNNTMEIIEAVKYLHNNSDEREKIAENGMRFVRKKFDIENIAQRYEQLYLEMQ